MREVYGELQIREHAAEALSSGPLYPIIMDLCYSPQASYAEGEKEIDLMEPRIDAQKIAPDAYNAMLGLESFVRKSSKLELSLLTLVKMRASQINGCAYCIDMHSKDARAEGETEQRLYALSAWRETPFFTERERAALEWTEAVTLIAEDRVPDHVYQATRQHFSNEELVNLTLAIVTINGWNRLCIAFRAIPGVYEPAGHKAETARRETVNQ
jgi:AhpD family alkylhydroperoxidase